MNVGLALSGGGARGIAHLGVLEACYQYGIQPRLISGVSAGAITGAFLSAGFAPRDVMKIIVENNILRYIRPSFSRLGFLTMERLRKVFEKFLPVTTFEELDIPLVISATNIEAGKTRFFNEGDLITPILASSCIPVIFKPVEIDGKHYMDGGLLNNLPAEPLLGYCEFIIGVHVNSKQNHFELRSAKNILERSFQVAVYNNVLDRYKYCDILIEPAELAKYSLFNLSNADEIFNIGYDHAARELEQLEGLDNG